MRIFEMGDRIYFIVWCASLHFLELENANFWAFPDMLEYKAELEAFLKNDFFFFKEFEKGALVTETFIDRK